MNVEEKEVKSNHIQRHRTIFLFFRFKKRQNTKYKIVINNNNKTIFKTIYFFFLIWISCILKQIQKKKKVGKITF